MSDITRITRRDLPARTSGTVLSEVRRPNVPARHQEVAEKLAQPKTSPRKPESNDASVKTSRG